MCGSVKLANSSWPISCCSQARAKRQSRSAVASESAQRSRATSGMVKPPKKRNETTSAATRRAPARAARAPRRRLSTSSMGGGSVDDLGQVGLPQIALACPVALEARTGGGPARPGCSAWHAPPRRRSAACSRSRDHRCFEQPHPRLVHEVGRLDRVPGPDPGKACVRQALQVRVDHGQQLLGGLTVPPSSQAEHSPKLVRADFHRSEDCNRSRFPRPGGTSKGDFEDREGVGGPLSNERLLSSPSRTGLVEAAPQITGQGEFRSFICGLRARSPGTRPPAPLTTRSAGPESRRDR